MVLTPLQRRPNYGVTEAASDVSLVEVVKPGTGVTTEMSVDPWLTGVNWATPWSAPLVMVTGEPMVPTLGTLLFRETCSEGCPPRSAWVVPEKQGAACGAQLLALLFSTARETVRGTGPALKLVEKNGAWNPFGPVIMTPDGASGVVAVPGVNPPGALAVWVAVPEALSACA